MNDYIMPIPVLKEVTFNEFYNGFELTNAFAVSKDNE
jgi:hypothetical protein